MSTWLTVVTTVYATLGTLVGLVWTGVLGEEGKVPYHLLPFVFMGGLLLWPYSLYVLAKRY